MKNDEEENEPKTRKKTQMKKKKKRIVVHLISKANYYLSVWLKLKLYASFVMPYHPHYYIVHKWYIVSLDSTCLQATPYSVKNLKNICWESKESSIIGNLVEFLYTISFSLTVDRPLCRLCFGALTMTLQMGLAYFCGHCPLQFNRFFFLYSRGQSFFIGWCSLLCNV